MSAAVYMYFMFVLILSVPKCQNINIFKVPEAPRDAVARKKVNPPQVPEVVPVKGTCLTVPLQERAEGKDRKP